MDNNIRELIEKELNLSSLSKEEADNILINIGELIMDLAVKRSVSHLDDDGLEKLSSLIENGKEDDVAIFLEENVPDLDFIVKESSKEVIDTYKK